MILPLIIILIIILVVNLRSKKSVMRPKSCGHSHPTMPMPMMRKAPVQMRAAPPKMGHEPCAGDYQEYMLNTGVASSIIDSHAEFTNDLQVGTKGASAETVFSHDDSIVPKWGLRRTTINVPISENAREVPSSTDEQIADNSGPLRYGFF